MSSLPTPSCHHALHHVDAQGRPLGSWVTVTKDNGQKTERRVVECRHCGKFYGAIPKETAK